MHGQLSGVESGDTGDITRVYQNNNVKLEILQAGDKATNIKEPFYAWANGNSVVYTKVSIPMVDDQVYSSKGNSIGLISVISDNTITVDDVVYAYDATKNINIPSIKDKYGEIYNTTVLEKTVDAKILYACDKVIEETASTSTIEYYNRAIPNGFRTNTVRFSSSCPYEIEVELDFPNGLFATRNVNIGTTKKQNFVPRYYKLPLNVAVQWRLTKPGQPSSDASSPAGWNNFNEMYFSAGVINEKQKNEKRFPAVSVPPERYTDQDRIEEKRRNRGMSIDTPTGFNEKWLNTNVFKLNPYTTQKFVLNNEQISKAVQAEYLVQNVPIQGYYTERIKATKAPYIDWDERRDYTFYGYSVTQEGEREGISVYNPPSAPNDKNGASKIVVYKSVTLGLDDAYKPEDFNINERRYVFRHKFDEATYRKIVGFTDKSLLDLIEVRVIRLTPCYINETDVSEAQKDSVSAMTYQDLTNWTYLRTKTFDKSKYLDALQAEADGKISNVRCGDYLQRPQAIDEDINRMTYIALQAEEDAVGSMRGSFNNLSVIAESLTPKWNIADKKWMPEKLWTEERYWRRFDDGTPSQEISKAEYDEHIAEDQDHYFKQACGNDFTKQIRDEVFIGDNLDSVNPIIKYTLPDEVANKYLSSNTAAQFVHAITGSFLTSDAKTYDCIEEDKTGEFYEFCEDIQDGTKEEYLGMDENLTSSIDNCNPSRVCLKQKFIDAGYTDFDGDYGTDYASTFINAPLGSETEAVVCTPVKNDGTIISKSNFDKQQSYYENGDSRFDNSIVMAKFTGHNCLNKANYYAQVYHMLLAAYMEGYDYAPTWTDAEGNKDIWLLKAVNILETFKNVPINALRSGIHTEALKQLNEAICKHDEIKVDNIYESYILDVMEQTLQSGQTYKLCKDSDGNKHFKFECNGVVTKDVKLETLLQKILITGRSYLKRSDKNKYEPLIGRPNPYPVTVLNQRNCISKSNTKAFEEPPCGFQVSCIDEEDNYTTNDFYVMRKGESYTNPSAKIEPLQIDFVTNKQQLASLAKFNLACRIYQIESYSRTIGMLGYAISLGDTVLLQDDTLLVGTDRAGRIVEFLEDETRIYGFTSDEPFSYTDEVNEEGLSVHGCLITQPTKVGAARCITERFATKDKIVSVKGREYKMTVGLTNLILLDKPILKNRDDESEDGETITFDLRMGDLLSFGRVGAESIKAVIMNIKPNEKGTFALTLAPYNEDLYQAGDVMPIFHSNMTVTDIADDYNFNDNVTQRTIIEEVNKINEPIVNEINNKLEILNLDEYPNNFDLTAIAQKDGIALRVITQNNSPNNIISKVKYQILEKQDTEEGAVYEEGPEGDKTYYGLKHEFETIDGEYLYLFNREVDGYPEIADLKNWLVRAKITNSYNNESLEWQPVTSMGVATPAKINYTQNSYKSWKPVINTSNIRYEVTENYIELHDDNNYTEQCYGDEFVTKFRIKGKNDEDFGPEVTGVYVFNRDTDGFPEIEDLREYQISVTVYNITSGKKSEPYVRNLKSTEYAFYKTYIMELNPSYVNVSVTRDSIDISNNQPFAETVYGKDFITECLLKRPDSYYEEGTPEEDKWVKFSNKYVFDRDIDGYPEREDLKQYKIKYHVLNTTTKKYSDEVELSLDRALTTYGTWKIGTLTVTSEVVDKTSIVTMNLSKTDREQYGSVRYGIRIKRIGNLDYNEMLDITPDSEFYTVNFNNTYSKESDYCLRDSDGNPLTDFYEFIGNKYTQTLPLIGQSNRLYLKVAVLGGIDYRCVCEDKTEVEQAGEALPEYAEPGTILKYEDKYYYYDEGSWKALSEFCLVATTYIYEVYAETECDKTDAVEISVTALPTSIVDIVKSHETYKSMYVEKLSAINANIGLITQGGMGDFSSLSNYWALSDLSPEESGTGTGVMQGAFRVGDEDQYIQVEPVYTYDEEGNRKRSFSVKIKAGNITLSSTGTTFNSGTFIYDDKDENKRMALTPNGMIIQVKEPGTTWEAGYTVIGELTLDGKGNLVITNADPSNRPKTGISIPNAHVYHFDKDLLDENGGNSENLMFAARRRDSPIISENSAINGRCYFGDVSKNIENTNNRLAFINTGSYVSVGKDIITKDGKINPEIDYWNNNASGLGLINKPFIYKE